MLLSFVLLVIVDCGPCKKKVLSKPGQSKNDKCDIGGIFSINEYGAKICEYPGDTCPYVKYFTYPDGGNSVELCCKSIENCNYDPVKNYCHPELKRCVDSFFFNCSNEKGGPIFDSCK